MWVFWGAGGSDLRLTYPQQIQLFSNTDGRLDTANVLSLENAFNFFFSFPHAVLTALHMSLAAKELLTNRHEIHSVSTQLGALVIPHLLLTCLLSFLHVPPNSFYKLSQESFSAACQYLEAELSHRCCVYCCSTKLSGASE